MMSSLQQRDTREARLLDLCYTATRAAVQAGATDAEAFGTVRETREVSYEKNDLNLARSDEELLVGIRVFCGQSRGFVTTNEPATIAEAARQAVTLARSSPADSHDGLPELRELAPADNLYDPALADLDTATLTKLTHQLTSNVYALDPRITLDQARLSVEEVTEVIHTTRGIVASSRATYLSGFVVGMALASGEVGSFTYDGAVGNNLQLVEAELATAARRFVEKAVSALGPRKGRSFKGTVILTPDAVGELLVEPLLAALAADAVRKGRSPLRGKLGSQLADSRLNLRDPGTRLGSFGMRHFDREGQPIRPLDLVVNGQLESFLYDSYEARLADRRSTGHARGSAQTPPRLSAGLAEILPGDRPASELEAACDLALLVPRFSGRVEMSTGDISGVVKGGFLLDHGERLPVTETMIAGNLYEALREIAALSSDRQQIFGTACFPAMLLEGISVIAC
ncbi:MAG: TldD/PmbA family protein [Cyanobacteria bacterium NC_groundwater_1444_Ag_S-0.65um_54_12]|nr:TldD/PmbA family protein [Cyanobacteria bacterium NC_groundwater_1444_Ag_S-0.65um_54_12]